jgi:FAD/FMN-containing dehydrogenase
LPDGWDAYLEDASGFRGHAERVLAPRGEDEVRELLREASAGRVPVTVAGAGTGVTGGRVPLGGWVLSLEKLNALEIREGAAMAGAGVLLRDLHAAAAATRQFYPPDPTETAASVGGIIATNASGARSFRYGATRGHVAALRVALADGTLLAVRRGDKPDFELPSLPLPATTKHTAGYFLRPGADWVDLFVGSEGTLGVVTAAELRLLPAPSALLAGMVFFRADEPAIEAVERWRESSGARMLEYFDRPSLDLLRRRFREVPPEAAAALLFEQELASLEDPAIDAWSDRLAAAGALMGESWFAQSPGDRERFRAFRHALPEAVNDIVRRNGFLKMGSDYAVPPARSREMLHYYRSRLEQEFPSQYVIFGHIGDAHLHVNILPESSAGAARAVELMVEFAREAVRLGGTVSAEHGLGKRKAHLLGLQYSSEQIRAMQELKRRLDPLCLLGRGTLWPPNC